MNFLLQIQSDFIPKNRKEHREAKKKVFVEFVSVNTFPSRNEKPAHSIQFPTKYICNDLVVPTAS